ncbi:hypothetical protein EJ03DRAFT_215592 [Teratosphaeria nubilosa]|uniref:Uncharacterized protein n=1 Tax=Teratosphaeria nubilosa TaxID=161662 RepID=A0A6G1LGY7_9PEZI|nr:hypothetical protein EJ03DRAFT_215592 [Teratosphaeria nubilosa]
MILPQHAQLMQGKRFVVGASDPGSCATNLNNPHGLRDPRDGETVLVRAALVEREKLHDCVPSAVLAVVGMCLVDEGPRNGKSISCLSLAVHGTRACSHKITKTQTPRQSTLNCF